MTSCRPSRRTSLPSFGGTIPSARVSPIRRPSAAAGGYPGVVHPVAPAGKRSVETTGSPTFLGNPLCSCPALRPRQDRRIRPLRCVDAAPAMSTAKAPTRIAFEAQSHGFGTGYLRFAGRVAPTPRKTRFRLLAKLFRTGLVTRRVPSKGFKMYPTSILLSQVQRSARTFCFSTSPA
jgi:hypothetical protein